MKKEFECEFCGKKIDGSYIDCGRFFCNGLCATRHFKKRHNLEDENLSKG